MCVQRCRGRKWIAFSEGGIGWCAVLFIIIISVK